MKPMAHMKYRKNLGCKGILTPDLWTRVQNATIELWSTIINGTLKKVTNKYT